MRKRWWWLVVGLSLLAVGAWLSRGEPDEAPRQATVVMPRAMTEREAARAQERSTLPAPPPPPAAPAKAPEPPRDPVLAMLPPKVETVAVVMEVNAIKNSDLGPLIVDCLGNDDPGFDLMRDAGFDAFEQVDRLGIVDEQLFITGNFQSFTPERLGRLSPTVDYGPDAVLYDPLRADGGPTGMHFGMWRKQLMVGGKDLDAIKASLDRLRAGGGSEPGVLSADEAYGEVYGVLEKKAIQELFDDADPKVADLVERTASRVRLHADVSHDVGVVADVEGNSPQDTEDLRGALTSALSLARMQAQATGQTQAAEVLSNAKALALRKGDGRFRLEAGLPYALLKTQLEKCAARRKAERADAGDDD
ncbi:MAG: hypothetical protein K1X89_14705 [Myxococcaceae bacterium]|nr:hypothetical protein [Myxococcaceae bacterium]